MLADTDIGAVIAAALQDPASGQMPNQAVMEFGLGIQRCVPDPSRALSTVTIGPPAGQTILIFPLRPLSGNSACQEWAMTAPTVSDGMLYVGADDGNVYALDATDGGPVWTFETGDVVRSPAVVSDGIVYAGSNDNMLYALDCGTGDLLWQHDTGSPVQYPPLVGDAGLSTRPRCP